MEMVESKEPTDVHLRALLESIVGTAFLFAPGPVLLHANKSGRKRTGEIDVPDSVWRAADTWSQAYERAGARAAEQVALPRLPPDIFGVQMAAGGAMETCLLLFRRPLLEGDPLPPRRSCERALAVLTARQRQVALLIVVGHTNPEIATALGLSISTVKDHVEHIMAKTGVHRRSLLAAYLAGRSLAQSRERADGA